MRSQLPVCVLGLALAACVTDDEPSYGTSEQELAVKCPDLFCGNTPYVGVYPFWELDLTGVTYSSNGLRVSGAVYGGVPQQLTVKGFLWERLPANSQMPEPIDDTVITLESSDTTTTYELTIKSAPPVSYVEDGDDGTPIPTYWVEYVAVVNGRRRPPVKVCGVEPGSSQPRPAIVFQGDRYSSTTGELIATGDATKPWFNITCKDDALWKLALMRHVDAAEDAMHLTSAAQRMALLRSIRADYCGDGTPYTKPGTAIDWINAGGWLTRDTDGGIEAVWGPKGAVCVDQTRLPDVVIDCDEATPEPPPCGPIFANWTSHGSVLTLVPAVD